MDNYKDKFERTFKYPFESIDKSDCVICLADKYQQHIKLPCGHSFHKVCLDRHIKSRKLCCPLCRKELEIKFQTKHPFKYILFTQEYNPNRFILVDRKTGWQIYHYMNDRLISKITMLEEGIIPWIQSTIQNSFDVTMVNEYAGNRHLVFQWLEIDQNILTAFKTILKVELYDDFIELD